MADPAIADEPHGKDPTSTEGLSPWALLLVLGFFVAGFVLVATRHWRRGSVMIGGSIFLAGLLRLVLTDEMAGLLVVRHKVFDVALCLGMGAAVMVLGMVVPGVYAG